MKQKFLRLLSLILVLILVLSTVAPMYGCGGDENGEENNNDQSGEQDGNEDDTNDTNNGDAVKTNYVVKLSSAGQMPLEGVLVTIRNEKNIIDRRETDENGQASFELEADGNYYAKLDESALEGYHLGDNKFALEAGGKNIVLTSAPIQNESIGNLPVDGYELGDIVHDFTITDLDGKSHSVSEVLKNKQLLVLNFWYRDCSNCAYEFPYLGKAYDKYSDRIEIFAINDYAGETVEYAKGLVVFDGDGNPVDLNFPMFKIPEYTVGKFDTDKNGYPVTVAIDRYGMICMVHVGGVIGEKYFTNMFDFFISDSYKQTIVTDMYDLAPVEKPNVDMPSSDAIADAFEDKSNSIKDKNVEYYPETDPEDAEYSWPFIIDEKYGRPCIKPSNSEKDNSYAILYAKVNLKAGEALVFDYISSTQNNSIGQDTLYVIVDGKDIYNISGVSENNSWKTCCTYVAREDGEYEVAFTYQKDIADSAGDDAVYLSNFRVIDAEDVDVETYIFRYAATKPSADGKSYNGYATVVYNEADGYYHVGDANGPLLLAHLLGYTNFDSYKTVFERVYNNLDDEGNPVFLVDGADKFRSFEYYGSYSSNSSLYGFVPVTKELKSFLIQYTNDYRTTVNKDESENLWLQLCCYYDAYGTGGKQMEDPIKGLASFSAYDTLVSTPDNPVKNTVTYETILVPRGKLFEFIPERSGVYRITSFSAKSVIGWVFTGNHEVWAENGDRTLYTDTSSLERLCEDLTVLSHYQIECSGCGALLELEKDQTKVTCSDPVCATVMTDLSAKKEVRVKDNTNISMLAYMEAGKPYYLAIAYHNVEDTGTFEFEVKYEGEQFASFIQASPGPFTVNEATGSIIARGINVALCNIDGCEECAAAAASMGAAEGTKYYHHKKADGTLGYLVYADFYQYTPLFNIQSIADLIEINAFNGAITETDRDALQHLEDMYSAGKEALFKSWGNIPMQKKIDRWEEYRVESILYLRDSGLEGEKLEQAKTYATYVAEEGKKYLQEKWGDDFDDMWFEYEMEDIIWGRFHGNGKNYTNDMYYYMERMLDEPDHPERQGCVPVDEKLAEMLQFLVDRYVFENVETSWRKLCYYYDVLG